MSSTNPEEVGQTASGNAFVIAFADDGRPIPVLVRSDGAMVLVYDGPPFRALCLDGISYPAG